MATKLTPAQAETLIEAVEKGLCRCVDTYQPANKLVALGLATSQLGTYGNQAIIPTEAGIEWVAKNRSEHTADKRA